MLVKTFGVLRFEDDTGGERRMPTRKTAALAAYLAMHPGKRFARDAVAGLLWGDKNDTCARHSLSQAISEVRRALGSEPIFADSQSVWSPGGALNVDALQLANLVQGHASREDLEAVERLYERDFLDGLELNQDAFECWVMAERERLRQLALTALSDLLGIKIRRAEFAGAINTARKILEIEPFHETAHRAIMRCYARQGAPRRAIDHYKAFAADLRRELDIGPEPATIGLHREIQSGDASPRKERTLSDFAFVLEQLPYAVAVTDTVNRIVGWNHVAEETFGFSKEEMFGRSPTVVYAPNHDSTLADQILQKAIAGGRWIGEVTMTAKDGHVCRQRRVVAPLFSPEGELVGAFGHGFVL